MALARQTNEHRGLYVVAKQEPGFILIPAKIAAIDGPVKLNSEDEKKKPVPRLYLFSVYQALAKHAGKSNVVWPRVKSIAKSLDCSEDLVHRTLKALEQIGVIAIEHQFKGGMKLSNRYVLIHQTPMNSDTAVSGYVTAVSGNAMKSDTAVSGEVAAVSGIELEQENYIQETNVVVEPQAASTSEVNEPAPSATPEKQPAPKAPKPLHPTHALIRAWSESTGIKSPGNWAVAGRLAKGMTENGITPEDIPLLLDWMRSDAFWARQMDFKGMAGASVKWLASKPRRGVNPESATPQQRLDDLNARWQAHELDCDYDTYMAQVRELWGLIDAH